MDDKNTSKHLLNSTITSRQLFSDIFFISLGILAAGFGLKGFLLPNGFIDGGVVGISLLMKELTDYSLLGTDCAVGKRTTALLLVQALKQEGLKASFISTGQTGLIQGAKYGIAIDVLSSGYATGAVENAVVNAYENERPDIIIVEGQGALSHPAFLSSCAILKGAQPDAIILQHAPRRKIRCDYPNISVPTLASEIELLEVFSKGKVIAISINHEAMTDPELVETIRTYEMKYQRPTTDALKYGCEKLVNKILAVFPALQKRISMLCQAQE